MQEFNREANTLCAKSGSSELTAIGLELKVVDRPDARAGAECGIADDGAAAAGRRGILIILSSPSGAGKSTLSRRLLEADPEVRFSISATTRPPRPGEQEGARLFLQEPPRVRGDGRGRRDARARRGLRQPLRHAARAGRGGDRPRARTCSSTSTGRAASRSATRRLRDAVVSIFILPPSIAELESRLRARGQDTDEVVAEPDGEVAGRDQPLGRVRLRAGQRAAGAVRGGAAGDHRAPSGCAATAGRSSSAMVRRLNGEFEGRLD